MKKLERVGGSGTNKSEVFDLQVLCIVENVE